MNVDYTGRQYEVTPALRKQIENGLSKIEKILSTHFDTHVILSAEKHRHIAEITVSVRNHNIVGVAEATDMTAAVGQALDRIERQAVKYKTRWRSKKRQARKKWNGEASVAEQQLAVGATVTTAVPVVVHAFPSIVRTAEAHVTRADDAVALRPLTLEEAIKEAEFRDRDVFVFRDNKGRVKVLHRTKDG
ncbi:MAG: ribosome-associated translation inhibitor RaiA, partial [Acidobacteriia bacterium]|nr:ribosome-associated translation inhibitor RaiA [Terriglobia bacterium]